MSPKDKKFLIFASLSALSLSILAIASNEGNGFLATETPTYKCADITFGTTQYASTSGVATSDFSSTNITVNTISTCTYCYAVSGSAARIGKDSTQGILTFGFTGCVISEAWVYCYQYAADTAADTHTLSLATSALSADSFKSVTATSISTITSTNPSDLPSALHWTGLDGGNGTSSTTLTVKSTDTARINLCKIVLKIVTGSTPSSKALSSIGVTTNPTKTSYTSGEALDTTGLVVTANYDDISSADVTSSCTLSPANGTTLSTVGTQTVSISYTYSGVTKTTSFSVTVTSSSTTLSSISVTNTKTAYTVGESLDISAITVTAHYNDTSTADVTSSTAFSPTTFSSAGTQDITASYSFGGTTKTAQFSVTVTEVVYTPSLSLASEELTLTLNSTDQTVAVTYSGFPNDSAVSLSASSSSSSVATASLSASNVIVHAVAVGTSTITVTGTQGGYSKSATMAVTITSASETGKSLQVYAIEQSGSKYGDCTLFHYGIAGQTAGYDLLIDGGNEASQTPLYDYVKKYVTDGVIDCLVLTHSHQDHLGGFFTSSNYSTGGTLASAGVTSITKIVECGALNAAAYYSTNWVACKSYWTSSSRPNGGATYYAVTNIKGTSWEIDGTNASIYWIDTGCYCADQTTIDTSSMNNYSVCCNVKFGTTDFIMCGDLPTTQEATLVTTNNSLRSNIQISNGDTVVYKACHHCSNGANSAAFLSFLKPDYAWTSSSITSTNSTTSGVKSEQHPYKTARGIIESQLDSTATALNRSSKKQQFYWNGTAGTIVMSLAAGLSASSFAITTTGREYEDYYDSSGTLIGKTSEINTYIESTSWASQGY